MPDLNERFLRLPTPTEIDRSPRAKAALRSWAFIEQVSVAELLLRTLWRNYQLDIAERLAVDPFAPETEGGVLIWKTGLSPVDLAVFDTFLPSGTSQPPIRHFLILRHDELDPILALWEKAYQEGVVDLVETVMPTPQKSTRWKEKEHDERWEHEQRKRTR